MTPAWHRNMKQTLERTHASHAIIVRTDCVVDVVLVSSVVKNGLLKAGTVMYAAIRNGYSLKPTSSRGNLLRRFTEGGFAWCLTTASYVESLRMVFVSRCLHIFGGSVMDVRIGSAGQLQIISNREGLTNMKL